MGGDKLNKHAYLIIANENFQQLALLLQAIDHPQNDIYVHVDAKSETFDTQVLEQAVKKGRLFFPEQRIRVFWGDYSLIACELVLLECAAEHGTYAYYHLLSGKDMPLKTQDEIHAFFAANAGKEFVRIGKHVDANFEFRYKYRYPWLSKVRNPKNKGLKIQLVLSILGQRIRGVDRTRANPGIVFCKGTQWFSITDQLARYVLSKKDWIAQTFVDGYCCDEVFLQTLVYNSEFRERLCYMPWGDGCSSNMRLIDWSRGRPYTFRMEDKAELEVSPCLFVRKIDEKVDPNLAGFLATRAKTAYNQTNNP